MTTILQKIGTVFAALVLTTISVTAAVGPAATSAPIIA